MMRAGAFRSSRAVVARNCTYSQSCRAFGRLTIPTVPMADVAECQSLVWVHDNQSVLDAMNVMLKADHDVVAVNKECPSGTKDETVGVLSKFGLMMKVSFSFHRLKTQEYFLAWLCTPCCRWVSLGAGTKGALLRRLQSVR